MRITCVDMGPEAMRVEQTMNFYNDTGLQMLKII